MRWYKHLFRRRLSERRLDGVAVYGNTLPMFKFLHQNNPGFEDLATYRGVPSGVNLTGRDRPEQVQALKVSRNYFRRFGANPNSRPDVQQ
jgi:hypothetical protein